MTITSHTQLSGDNGAWGGDHVPSCPIIVSFKYAYDISRFVLSGILQLS